MSYTEIYGFDRNGYAYLAGETHNSWQGAMAIWQYFENTYLPQYIPDHVKDLGWYHEEMSSQEILLRLHYTPSRCSSMSPKAMKEVWELCERDDVPIEERIVLMTTFDNYLIKTEDIPAVIDAFTKFKGESSLKKQIAILETLYKSDNCIAVGWNQSSVNATNWSNRVTIDGEDQPYNCLTQSEHHWLFEDSCVM